MAEEIDRRRDDDAPPAGELMAVDSTDVRTFADHHLTVSTDPDARWGHRTPKAPGGRKSRARGDKHEPFLGYKVHLVCDANWGFPVDYILLPANRGDSPVLPEVMARMLDKHPTLRPRYLTADRGYDAISNYEWLDGKRIFAVIGLIDRRAKKDVYTLQGAPTCLGGKAMELVRTDRKKGHLFRCPEGGCELKDRGVAFTGYCEGEHYEDPRGNPELLRKVGRLPRAGRRWEKLYDKRTAIERLFRSLKASRLLDLHRYRGLFKVGLHVALSNLTCVATMLMRVLDGDLEGIRRMRLDRDGRPQ